MFKKNNSEVINNYEVELESIRNDKSVFKGPAKFSIKPKEIYNYELKFVPNAEERFEVIIKDLKQS